MTRRTMPGMTCQATVGLVMVACVFAASCGAYAPGSAVREQCDHVRDAREEYDRAWSEIERAEIHGPEILTGPEAERVSYYEAVAENVNGELGDQARGILAARADPGDAPPLLFAEPGSFDADVDRWLNETCQ